MTLGSYSARNSPKNWRIAQGCRDKHATVELTVRPFRPLPVLPIVWRQLAGQFIEVVAEAAVEPCRTLGEVELRCIPADIEAPHCSPEEAANCCSRVAH